MLQLACGRENNTPDMLVKLLCSYCGSRKSGLGILSILNAWLQPCRFRYQTVNWGTLSNRSMACFFFANSRHSLEKTHGIVDEMNSQELVQRA